MDYPKLQTEITTDPVPLAYAGKTDQQIADLLNSTTTGRTLPRAQVSKREIFNAIADAEWPTTGILQNKLLVLFSQDFVDPTNANARAIIGSIFGPATTSRANLLALANRTVSRAEELNLGGPVAAIDVNRAKSGVW